MAVIEAEADLAFASRLADTAREIALAHFRTGAAAEDKPGAIYDPVTEADRAIEARMRGLIGEHRPGDGVLGEEAAPTASHNGRTWVIDPIDGTRAFIAGLPTWCVLIALCDETGPRLSVIDQPFTGERFIGVTGESAFFEHGGMRRPMRTREGVRCINEAILSTTDPGLFSGAERAAFDALGARARVRRFGLDAYGYAALALGGVDLVIENGLKPWDVGALIPVVSGAGGVITDWRGGACHRGGQVVAASSADLHAEALETLSKAAL